MSQHSDLKDIFEYIEKEKKIDRNVLIQAIESSLLLAARKSFKHLVDPRVTVNASNLDIKVWSSFKVVDHPPQQGEILISKVKMTNPNAAIGEVIEIESTPEDFGRIAAQTAKHIIIQKIREAEKDTLLQEYKSKKGDIVNGIIRRIESSDLIIIDLGNAEGVLPKREQSPNEIYTVNARIKVYVVDIITHARRNEIILSRTHPGLVQKLFELEVPEISDGIVVIKAIAREPGFRSKIAVHSLNDKVDSVGACVGMRGDRIKNIVHDLGGEKIDVVTWDPNPEIFIKNALSPAKLKKVILVPAERKVDVIVDPDQLSLTIGKKGQNARLCSKLTGWKIDINKELDIKTESVQIKETHEETNDQSS